MGISPKGTNEFDKIIASMPEAKEDSVRKGYEKILNSIMTLGGSSSKIDTQEEMELFLGVFDSLQESDAETAYRLKHTDFQSIRNDEYADMRNQNKDEGKAIANELNTLLDKTVTNNKDVNTTLKKVNKDNVLPFLEQLVVSNKKDLFQEVNGLTEIFNKIDKSELINILGSLRDVCDSTSLPTDNMITLRAQLGNVIDKIPKDGDIPKDVQQEVDTIIRQIVYEFIQNSK